MSEEHAVDSVATPCSSSLPLVVFLDIDGVLNDHDKMENRYCGTKPSCVHHFNRILNAYPEAKIVITSAWRYMILKGEMNLAGFEMLLQTHGVCCYQRVIGHTRADGRIEDEPHHHDEPERWRLAGLKWRKLQIEDWTREHAVERFLVIDDLPLEMDSFYQTDGTKGLTSLDVERISAMLTT